jgi:hypothetical protein
MDKILEKAVEQSDFCPCPCSLSLE